MSDEARQSLAPALWWSIVAVVAFLALRLLGRSLTTSGIAFLSIEGTILLACSIQTNDDMLVKSWKERLLGTPFAYPVAYVPLFFYLGLVFLATASFVGAALAQN
jgi:hypothetical protein